MLEDFIEILTGIGRALFVSVLFGVILFLVFAIPAAALVLAYKFISLIF